MRVILLMLAALVAAGQYPESVPGAKRPARNPAHFPKNKGIPIPSKGKKRPAKAPEPAITHTLKGALRRIDTSEIVLTADDARTITARRVSGARFLKDGKQADPALFRPGDRIAVGANRDEEGYFHAVTVTFEREGTESERAAASLPVTPSEQSAEMERRPVLRRSGEQPEQSAEPEEQELTEVKPVTGAEPDPDRPQLRRGKPKPRQTTSVATNVAPQNPMPWKPAPSMVEAEKQKERSEDPRIVRARETVARFTEALPNYLCQQHITRYVSNTQPANWRAQDVITAALVFENGRERYTNLSVNGKPVKKTIEDLGGTWSKGEFGSILADLFDRSTDAQFQVARNTTVAGRTAVVFDFEVAQENSHWRVSAPSQVLNPAYKGSIWLDADNFQALRVELQGWKLPREFPFSVIESAVDFGYIRLGERSFLVPVHAEVLSCARESGFCSRNAMDFRNYRKFDGESRIQF